MPTFRISDGPKQTSFHTDPEGNWKLQTEAVILTVERKMDIKIKSVLRAKGNVVSCRKHLLNKIYVKCSEVKQTTFYKSI